MKNRRSIGPVELVLQSCPSENGAAALAMVLSYYGRPAVMRDLMQQPIASAADLVSAAQSRGIYAQGYQMNFAELRQAPLPLIAHWEFRSFVVVTGLQGEKVCVNSPEDGFQVLSRRAFEKGFTGVAICFAEDETGQQRSGSETSRERLWTGSALPVLLAAAQMFIAAGYGLLAVLSRSIAGRLSSPQLGGGLSLCLELGLVILMQGAAVAFQIWLVGRCRDLFHARSIRAFQERIRRESNSCLQKTSCFRLDEAARGRAAESDSLARWLICVMQLVSGAVCLAVMAVQSLFAAIAALLVAAVFCGVCFLRRERLYSDGKLCSRAAFFGEDLAARDLADWEKNQLCGADTDHFRHWAEETGSAFRPLEMEREKAYWYLAAAGELLAVFCVCLLEMIAGRAGGADLLGCMLLAAAAAASMGAFPCLMEEKMAERRCRESTEQIFQGEPEDRVPSGVGTAETLTVQNVSMRPSGKAAVVKDVTFTLRRGEILVVTGSAEIRAALAAGIAGLERPAQGEMYLDQRNMADLSDREICTNITLLGVGVPSPRGTVRENIAAGLQNITDYAVMEAASDALLHQSVLRRTSGYDTPVSTLSSGEQLLLEFARAFARGTPFLVCDGLTRKLDAETEDQLIRNMRRRGVGVVLLTEDAALLPKGDIACRIEDGRTVLRERAEFVEEEVHGLV